MKIGIIAGILTLALVILPLIGCSEVVTGAEPGSAETDSVAVEEVVPQVVKGLAEELALEASDIGPGWVRSHMDVKAEGNWIDQSFHRVSIKDNLEFSEYAIEITKVYPDVESALLDSEFYGARLKSEIEERVNMVLDLPFWDEAYVWNDIILRKGNIIVSFKVGRGISRYDPLLEQYASMHSTMRTPEQEEWLDREQYADDLLYNLAEKARDKISTEEPFK